MLDFGNLVSCTSQHSKVVQVHAFMTTTYMHDGRLCRHLTKGWHDFGVWLAWSRGKEYRISKMKNWNAEMLADTKPTKSMFG